MLDRLVACKANCKAFLLIITYSQIEILQNGINRK